MKKEKSLVIIKPGFIQYELPIIEMLEKLALVKIIKKKKMRLSKELLAQHYSEHIGKSFYEGMIDYMASDDVIVLVAEGDEGMISRIRVVTGATKDAAPGTIRHRFGTNILPQNVLHASDSPKAAEREIAIFFPARVCKRKK